MLLRLLCATRHSMLAQTFCAEGKIAPHIHRRKSLPTKLRRAGGVWSYLAAQITESTWCCCLAVVRHQLQLASHAATRKHELEYAWGQMWVDELHLPSSVP